MSDDPFAIVEAMTICGIATAQRTRLPLHARRVSARPRRASPTPIGAARARGTPRRRRRRVGASLRHRDPPRRRRLHLRRGDGALQLARGQARRAALEAAVPGAGRPVRQADRGQQRRDAGQRARHPGRGRRGVGGQRHAGTRPARACSACRATSPARASTRLPFGAHAARGPRARRRRRRRRRAPGRCCSAAPPGSFVGPEALDVPLTFEAARAAGATLGSGVVLVFDDTADLRRHAGPHRRVLRRRVVRPVRALPGRHGAPARAARAVAPPGRRWTCQCRAVALLTELGQAMRDASICGLGQTASSAIESAVQRLQVFRGRTA